MKNMKNKKTEKLLNIGWVVFALLILVLVLVFAIQRISLTNQKNQEKPPTESGKADNNPVRVKTFFDIDADQPIKAFIGETEVTEPGTELNLPPGVYMVRLVDENGREHIQPLVIDKETKELRQKLIMPPERKTITIVSSQEESELYFDGQFIQHFNQEITLMVPFGKKEIEVRKKGYTSISKTEVIDENSPTEYLFEIKTLP